MKKAVVHWVLPPKTASEVDTLILLVEEAIQPSHNLSEPATDSGEASRCVVGRQRSEELRGTTRKNNAWCAKV
jgi:hypothetical protein